MPFWPHVRCAHQGETRGRQSAPEKSFYCEDPSWSPSLHHSLAPASAPFQASLEVNQILRALGFVNTVFVTHGCCCAKHWGQEQSICLGEPWTRDQKEEFKERVNRTVPGTGPQGVPRAEQDPLDQTSPYPSAGPEPHLHSKGEDSTQPGFQLPMRARE